MLKIPAKLRVVRRFPGVESLFWAMTSKGAQAEYSSPPAVTKPQEIIALKPIKFSFKKSGSSGSGVEKSLSELSKTISAFCFQGSSVWSRERIREVVYVYVKVASRL